MLTVKNDNPEATIQTAETTMAGVRHSVHAIDRTASSELLCAVVGAVSGKRARNSIARGTRVLGVAVSLTVDGSIDRRPVRKVGSIQVSLPDGSRSGFGFDFRDCLVLALPPPASRLGQSSGGWWMSAAPAVRRGEDLPVNIRSDSHVTVTDKAAAELLL
jgi:hypothetical protein